MIYTHPVDLKDGNYAVRVAKTIRETCQPIEAGFENITEIGWLKALQNEEAVWLLPLLLLNMYYV